jgi:hypothetical protein
MKVCKKLHELPLVATEWQQTTWHPDCEHYYQGTCGNPTRSDDPTPCPFDGKALPLREETVDLENGQSQKLLGASVRTAPERRPRCAALEQAIQRQIVQRTGARIQGLEVAVTEDRVIVSGCVVCYYLKQLTLQGVFDVLGSAAAMGIELHVEVIGSSPLTRGMMDARRRPVHALTAGDVMKRDLVVSTANLWKRFQQHRAEDRP